MQIGHNVAKGDNLNGFQSTSKQFYDHKAGEVARLNEETKKRFKKPSLQIRGRKVWPGAWQK